MLLLTYRHWQDFDGIKVKQIRVFTQKYAFISKALNTKSMPNQKEKPSFIE